MRHITGRSPSRTAANDPAERRFFPRRSFKGTAFPAQVGRKDSQIRLRDLSCGGASGLIEEPLAIGDHILITFDERHRVEAEVRWTRRVMVGLKFTNLLSADYVDDLQEQANRSFLAALQVERGRSAAAQVELTAPTGARKRRAA